MPATIYRLSRCRKVAFEQSSLDPEFLVLQETGENQPGNRRIVGLVGMVFEIDPDLGTDLAVVVSPGQLDIATPLVACAVALAPVAQIAPIVVEIEGMATR